jgi:hypothetical protein
MRAGGDAQAATWPPNWTADRDLCVKKLIVIFRQGRGMEIFPRITRMGKFLSTPICDIRGKN